MAKSKKVSQEKVTLSATQRTLQGKKLKKLRKDGLLPANIFGKDFKSTSISVSYKEFVAIYKTAGETGIVYLSLDNKEIPTLIKSLQKHPISDLLLHADFRKIDLKQVITAEVPIKIDGVSEAVAQKAGILLTQLNKLLVEALPQDIPHEIVIDIAVLKDIGQEIKVSDIASSEKYKIKTDGSKVVLSVVAHKEESVTPETTTATPEVITAKTEEGVTEGTVGQTSESSAQKNTPAPADKTQKEVKK